jgi:hypothetical protein
LSEIREPSIPYFHFSQARTLRNSFCSTTLKLLSADGRALVSKVEKIAKNSEIFSILVIFSKVEVQKLTLDQKFPLLAKKSFFKTSLSKFNEHISSS